MVTRIRDLDPAIAEESTRASSSLFQTPDYARALEAAGADAYLMRALDLDGRALGHVIVLEQATLGFRQWTCVAEPAIRAGADSARFWESLVSAGRAREVLSVAWREAATVRLGAETIQTARAVVEGAGCAASVGAFGTYRVALSADEDALWGALHRKHRTMIRAARVAAVDVTTKAEEFADEYVPLSDATWARSGTQGPVRPYFEKLLDLGTRGDWVQTYLARNASGTPVAGAIVVSWRDRAVYLHGATADDAQGAGALLQWSILCDLRRRGAATYDLGGVVLPGSPFDHVKAAGIRRFKSRFGGHLEEWPSLQLLLDPARYESAREQVRAARAQAARSSKDV